MIPNPGTLCSLPPYAGIETLTSCVGMAACWVRGASPILVRAIRPHLRQGGGGCLCNASRGARPPTLDTLRPDSYPHPPHPNSPAFGSATSDGNGTTNDSEIINGVAALADRPLRRGAGPVRSWPGECSGVGVEASDSVSAVRASDRWCPGRPCTWSGISPDKWRAGASVRGGDHDTRLVTAIHRRLTTSDDNGGG